ncbi:hypothetical protein [Parashewanella tropica]|uniref:hypothetical protein n=1 Tax=Parashewanella tropica TaxID=2547970 RepID=UPI00105A55A3|nr:hypothetical protein [Parashewanella tropica]
MTATLVPIYVPEPERWVSHELNLPEPAKSKIYNAEFQLYANSSLDKHSAIRDAFSWLFHSHDRPTQEYWLREVNQSLSPHTKSILAYSTTQGDNKVWLVHLRPPNGVPLAVLGSEPLPITEFAPIEKSAPQPTRAGHKRMAESNVDIEAKVRARMPKGYLESALACRNARAQKKAVTMRAQAERGQYSVDLCDLLVSVVANGDNGVTYWHQSLSAKSDFYTSSPQEQMQHISEIQQAICAEMKELEQLMKTGKYSKYPLLQTRASKLTEYLAVADKVAGFYQTKPPLSKDMDNEESSLKPQPDQGPLWGKFEQVSDKLRLWYLTRKADDTLISTPRGGLYPDTPPPLDARAAKALAEFTSAQANSPNQKS